MNDRQKKRFSAIMKALKVALCVLAGLIFCFSAFPGHADEPEKTMKVIVTGIGADTAAARLNAIRNAVEQVIGVYVSADTLVKNHAILKDEILGYSGGYVRDSRIVSEEHGRDGLVAVTIEADVVASKLKRKLEFLNIAVRNVEGEKLFDEAYGRLEEKRSGAALLEKIISKYPQAAYNFEVGAPQIKSVDQASGKATLNISLKLRWDQSFIDELRSVMEQVARQELKMVDIISFSQGVNNKYLRNGAVVCFSSQSRTRAGMAENCMILENQDLVFLSRHGDKNQKQKVTHTDRRRSLINLPASADAMPLILTFKDRAGNEVHTVSYAFKRQDSDGCDKQGIAYERGNPRSSSLRFALSGEGFKPPNILWRDLRNRRLLIVTDGVFNIDLPVRMDANILKEVQTIEVNINPWTQ
jgi:hypothetical protein